MCVSLTVNTESSMPVHVLGAVSHIGPVLSIFITSLILNVSISTVSRDLFST